MLVDDHQPVLGLGDDIGRRDLPARDAERDSSGPAAIAGSARAAGAWSKSACRLLDDGGRALLAPSCGGWVAAVAGGG